jgi:hypothetical protein
MPVSDPIDELLEEVPVIEEDVQREAVKQVELFVKAARLRVEAMRKQHRAGAELEAKKAGLAVAIRNKKNLLGEKITEGALKEKLEMHSLVRKLREESDQAYEHEELAKLVLEALRQRRDAIRVIADMQAYEGMREGAEVERISQRKKLVGEVRKIQSRRRVAVR